MVNDPLQQKLSPLPGDQRKSYACLWGCLAMFGAAVVVVVIGVFAAYGIAKKAVNAYTDAAPTALPEVQIDPAQYEALRDRIEDFAAAIEGESGTRTLSLTAKEINALLQNDPDLAELSGMVHVSIENDALKGEVSFPLRELA